MKNKVLKVINLIATTTFTLSATMLDSISNIPYIVCAISLAWICLFLYANKERYLV